ncbi:hypothetical protein ACIQNG_14945 [Streptomyces sp. NPDC091377]|uniref:hypothetical protein n=1 Tax=Streptomyces sp. NPDC091377 TaxID=3365995 RepID=UPI003809884C
MRTWSPNFPGSGTVVEEAWLAGRAEGMAKGRAGDILHILGVRGIDVSDADRERITSCVDLEVLGEWFDRSLSVTSAEELFAEGGTGDD